MPASTQHAAPLLYGLVLAGGDSSRMGRDKGQLRYHGDQPQVLHALELLAAVTHEAYVSVRSEQASLDVYVSLPLIVDDGTLRGPAAGLLAAWDRLPQVAWLVLATDLPFANAALVTGLIAARDASRIATAYRHSDGTPEPLCTIWEPAARVLLAERARTGDRSLRRLLLDGSARVVDTVDTYRLQSVDSRREHHAAQAMIANRAI